MVGRVAESVRMSVSQVENVFEFCSVPCCVGILYILLDAFFLFSGILSFLFSLQHFCECFPFLCVWTVIYLVGRFILCCLIYSIRLPLFIFCFSFSTTQDFFLFLLIFKLYRSDFNSLSLSLVAFFSMLSFVATV